MNPQTAPPQYGQPQNYGGYPGQGMAPPPMQKPMLPSQSPQGDNQQFSPQMPQPNNYSNHGGSQEQGSLKAQYSAQSGLQPQLTPQSQHGISMGHTNPPMGGQMNAPMGAPSQNAAMASHPPMVNQMPAIPQQNPGQLQLQQGPGQVSHQQGPGQIPQQQGPGQIQQQQGPGQIHQQQGPGQIPQQQGPGQIQQQQGPGQIQQQQGPGQIPQQQGPGQIRQLAQGSPQHQMPQQPRNPLMSGPPMSGPPQMSASPGQQAWNQGPQQNFPSQPIQNHQAAPHPMAPPNQAGPPKMGQSPGRIAPGPGMPPPGSARPPMNAYPGATLPHPGANVEQLSGMMGNMNVNGAVPPTNMQMNMNGPTPGMQPGIPPMMGQRNPPALNGGQMPPQMNGVDPNRPPMQHRYPENAATGYPPAQGGYPPPMGPQGMTPRYPQPPGPGHMQQPPYPGAQPSYHPEPVQRKLDPDLMPSPIEVVMEDQHSKAGVFYTNQKGQVPPLVTTDFIVVDQGNSSPRFMRSTMYNIPITNDMLKQTAVPFSLVISPMAELLEEEQSPPLVDFGELGPVRCIRCKAYMSPNMQFFDGGRRFVCLLCKASTEVPAEYFQHLDQTGLRVDRFERPELMLGTYDIIATHEYCRDGIPPKPPALIFLIDVSYNNIKSGLVSLLCSQMRSFLDELPKERGQEKSSLRVGFITYNSSVHFYNLNPNLCQPQMLVVGDINEMFMPLLDGFLVDAEESGNLIDMLMQQIPSMFADTKETEIILAPAITAGLEALKAAGCAGKLLVFHSSLPLFEAPGKLKNRDDRKLLGTDKEKTVLTPQNKVYNDLGQDCVQAGCSIDMFIFNNAFIDLATIGQVPRLTGGEVFKYTYFQADLDGDRIVADVRSAVRRLCAFDAVMRVRTSAGIRPMDFYGHFFMSNTTDIELAAVDPDKAIAVEIKHDDKLTEEDNVYIQTALLYTSLSGQRRIRILNLALKACSLMTDLFRSCDLDTVMNFFTKQAVSKILDATPKAIKDNYIQRSAQILACYRKNCASPTSAGQLILPEGMKLLPLYINCMLKCDAVSGGSDMTIDDRWFTMAAATIMDVPSSAVYLYPRLVPVVDLTEEPVPIRCSAEKMADNGVYLFENGIYMFLWLGLAAPSDWIASVFGVPSTAQVDTDKNRLPILDNPVSEKLREYISLVASNRHRSMRLTLVRQRDKMELVMKHFLVEDKGVDGSPSYVDFLCHLHKEIRDIVS